jgi:hypothetical protein
MHTCIIRSPEQEAALTDQPSPTPDARQRHQQRAAFLRKRAAHFRAERYDEVLSYAADLEVEADEIDHLLALGEIDA